MDSQAPSGAIRTGESDAGDARAAGRDIRSAALVTRADRWEPRRHVASWTTGPIIERTQIGSHAYRVTFYNGIEVTRSEDFTDPAAAQRFWIDLQRAYLDEL